ncbi:MAG TPA: hypothetical protein V6C91_22060 [Coleofasciculaceae cyanobacterium]
MKITVEVCRLSSFLINLLEGFNILLLNMEWKHHVFERRIDRRHSQQ